MAANAKLSDDRRQPHTLTRDMFIPRNQFHPYSHVTSRGRHGDGRGDEQGGPDDDDDDDADDDDVDDDGGDGGGAYGRGGGRGGGAGGRGNANDDAAELTIVCKAARDYMFYLVNVHFILVFTNDLSLQPVPRRFNA